MDGIISFTDQFLFCVDKFRMLKLEPFARLVFLFIKVSFDVFDCHVVTFCHFGHVL